MTSSRQLPAEREQKWLAAARKGDQQAYGYLVQHYQALVVHVAYRVCQDMDTAYDVAQETFIKAWKVLPRFQPQKQGSFRAWLCRIARNQAIDVMRKEHPTEELAPGLPYRQSDPDPEAWLLRQESIHSIEQAIQQLPEAMRLVLILREIEGLSYREIAVALDIPPGTVMSRLHHARKRLAAHLRSTREVLV